MGNAVMCFGWLVFEGRSAGSDDEHSSNALAGRSAASGLPSKLPYICLHFHQQLHVHADVCTHNIKARHIYTRASLILIFLNDCLHHGWHCLGQRIDLVFWST